MRKRALRRNFEPGGMNSSGIAHLRESKATMPEDDYYQKLEVMAVEWPGSTKGRRFAWKEK